MWSIFTPLRRTLAGAGRSPAVGDTVLSFESDWANWLRRAGLPPTALRDIVASGSLHPHFAYRRFSKPKPNGGRRELAEPSPLLKRIQHEIAARYLTVEQSHPAAIAYQKGKSTANHVWAHAGAAVIVTADVRDFFPSTRAERIETWWRERVDFDTARLLALLTTDRGGLPQGAPTSPALSNLVNVELDTRLSARAAVAGARYTRYCDDLAFSWPVGVGPLADFDRGVRAVLHEFGYALHPDKGWCVYQRDDEPEVTGAVLTRSGRVRLPERIRRVMRALAVSPKPRDAKRLEGYEGYEEMLTKRLR